VGEPALAARPAAVRSPPRSTIASEIQKNFKDPEFLNFEIALFRPRVYFGS
jgi:hypothetical protein